MASRASWFSYTQQTGQPTRRRQSERDYKPQSYDVPRWQIQDCFLPQLQWQRGQDGCRHVQVLERERGSAPPDGSVKAPGEFWVIGKSPTSCHSAACPGHNIETTWKVYEQQPRKTELWLSTTYQLTGYPVRPNSRTGSRGERP